MNTWRIGNFCSQCSLYWTHDGNPIPLRSTIGPVLYRMLRDSMLEPKKSPPSYLLSPLSKDFICCHSGVFPIFVATGKPESLLFILISTINNCLWMPIKSSLLPINIVSSLASKIPAASYMVQKPYFWNSNLVFFFFFVDNLQFYSNRKN